ncbi:MAG TPA: hypothetical protein H9848_09890 [Candidatus Parabacteroides intestinigallinarum]|uniref:DUF6383 domain-containing protein n=1 Tax=Candidatus Parabacteroides intestinigallinarum TaxID=2838722 RepID=A0A9D1XVN9_9BACT|nr:hypothetical protein [Candidatus Parabacteroides intestinigallinarum]
MNKKFSTLLAGIMLASAFTAGAQTAVKKYENGKSYLLSAEVKGTKYALTVESDATDPNYGKLSVVDANTVNQSIKSTNEALWTVSFTEGVSGNAPKFTFINKATSLTLSLNTTDENEDDVVDDLKIAGSITEWLNTSMTDNGDDNLVAAPLYSYIEANKVVYLDITSGDLTAKIGSPDNAGSAAEFAPYEAAIINNLTAEDLNTQLQTAKSGWFNLTFNRDVTTAGNNLFANTSLKAEPASTNYVKLIAKDKKVKDENGKDVDAYIVVDTAYYAGSENSGALVKFTYANLDEKKNVNELGRWAASYEYNFAYDPTENRLLIKSKGYLKKLDKPRTSGFKGGNMTEWGDGSDATNDKKVENAYIRLAELTSAREITVAGAELANGKDPVDDKENGMLTTVTIGVNANTYVPTTIAEGLYLIKVRTAGSTEVVDGSYFIANLGGAFGYVEQAKNQNFDHMPAAQWYVKQNGTSATAPVEITNREFFDDPKGTTYTLSGQLFKAGDNVFFAGGDTLEFVKVSDESKKNAKLGYKYVTNEEASVETYVFNYLHGLSLEKGLNTPAGKDSIVRVDETGAKAQFRLVSVVTDDSYGLQLDEKETGIANLIRNVYYIKAYDSSKFGGEDRYLNYDETLKKYVMSSTPQAFFLKENNDVDGTHYYALVEANFRATTSGLNYLYSPADAGKKAADVKTLAELKVTEAVVFDEDGNLIVADASEIEEVYGYKNVNGVVTLAQLGQAVPTYGTDGYASHKVSVDDNSLDLTQGSIDDKFDGNTEIRTSAFAVVADDSPLYRRFNGVVPGTNGAEANYGSEANAPLQLKFFRFNNDAEFLAENSKASNAYRDELKDNTISFLGVNNEYQFNEADTLSYTFYVDTAYVRNNTRMPQYMLAVRPEFVEGDTIWCQDPNHKTHADSLNCYHTKIYPSFTRAMYLFNAQDSVTAKNADYEGKAAYGAQGYTRLAFIDAIHANDTLYILKDKSLANDQIDFRNADLFAQKIALGNNMHKNVVFQFRLIDDSNLRFLIESETQEGGKAVLNADLTTARIAPEMGGWVKIQNGVPVIAHYNSFNEAIAQAEIFDVTDEIEFAPTANEDIAVEEGVQVIAGNGAVTIQGAAGKTVVITNILGKAVANTVLTSDNQTINVPAGIVTVAVEGEEAVKAIVK